MAKPHFSRRPPVGTETPPSTPIYRLARGAQLRGVILSQELLGAHLHWLHNRSVAHVEPNDDEEQQGLTAAELCQGCQAGRPIYWEGYAAIWSPRNNGIGIIPVSPGNVDVIDTYVDAHGTLRGAEAMLSRPSLKTNARTVITLQRSDVPAAHIPACPDVERILRHVWGLDQANADVAPAAEQGSERAAQVNAERLRTGRRVDQGIAPTEAEQHAAQNGNGKAVRS